LVPLGKLLAHGQFSIVGIVEQLALKVFLFLWCPCSKRKPQELVGPSGFHILLI